MIDARRGAQSISNDITLSTSVYIQYNFEWVFKIIHGNSHKLNLKIIFLDL